MTKEELSKLDRDFLLNCRKLWIEKRDQLEKEVHQANLYIDILDNQLFTPKKPSSQ